MDAVLHLSIALPCDARRAYAMFADAALVATWLAPAAEVEPVVGGKYEIYWEAGDKSRNATTGCRVTAVTEGELLAFEWKGPLEFEDVMNQTDPLTHVTVAFIPRADGCVVHLVHSGWHDEPMWEVARRWFERAWGLAFESLRKRVTAG